MPVSSIPGLSIYRFIPDPIWGNIPITKEEHMVIQQDVFTRLKEIKQMGVAWIHYTGAVHNRAQHSIGVMHLADMMLDMVMVAGYDPSDNVPLSSIINLQERKLLRLAALLHDLGHPPLSHVLEECLRKYPELLAGIKDIRIKRLIETGRYAHESGTRCLIGETEIQKILSQILGKPHATQLADLAIGQMNKNGNLLLLNFIINSDIDADKIDYILRDSYYCGIQPIFKVEDLHGKIFIDYNTKRVFISPEGIGAITSLLHARHRLMAEVHHEQNGRIATQVMIQKIRDILTKPKKNLELINMHFSTDYTDERLNLFLADNKEADIVQSLRKGNLGYYEMYSKDFLDFDPVTRNHLFAILDYPPSIPKLQEKVREISKSSDLILDIRIIKTPQLNVLIDEGKQYKPTIFDRSYIARGMLFDSVRSLKLYVYAPNGMKCDIDYKEIQSLIGDCGLWASEQKALAKEIWGLDLITIILESLKQSVNNISELQKLEAYWVYSQTAFHQFISAVISKLNVNTPYSEPSEYVDIVFVRDLTTLIIIGLVESREIPISQPQDTKVLPSSFAYGFRRDFRISEYGSAYCKSLKTNDKLNSIINRISKIVTDFQNEHQDGIIEFAKTELQMRNRRAIGPIKSTWNLQLKRHDLREPLRDKAALMIP